MFLHLKYFDVIILRPATVCGYSPRTRLDVIVNILTNNAYNKNGVYSIKLSIDGNIHYEFRADELDFSTTRYI